MIVHPRVALERAAHWLPEALVTPAAFERLIDLACGLPDAFSDAGLECRLGSNSRVDFLVAMLASEDGHRRLLGKRSREAAPVNAAWERVFDLCDEWSSLPLLAREVPLVWLEFDVEESARETPVPYAFPCVHRGLLGGGEWSGPSSGVPRDVIDRVIAILLGRPAWPPVARALDRCLDTLPEAGRVLHMAPLSTRGLDAIRIVLDVPVTALPAYLALAGWPGRTAALEKILAAMYEPHEYIGCHLDVGPEVGPTLGLEVYRADGRWAPPLDRLVAWGACTPEKRDAVLSWPGSDSVVLPEHQLPSLQERVLLLKLVYHPQEPLAAKAYMGFRHRFAFLLGIRPGSRTPSPG